MMTTRRFRPRIALPGIAIPGIALPALAGVLVLGLSGAAMAKDNQDRSDAATMAAAKVSLAQAITTAEQHAGGKAFDAGVDNQNGKARISVEVAGGQGVRTVLIDPATGAVVGTHAGGEDQEGEGGHED